MPTKKIGLNEDEYLAIVERIQQAMCIEPFRPDAADVMVLIGTCRVLNQEIERLRAELKQAWALCQTWKGTAERLASDKEC